MDDLSTIRSEALGAVQQAADLAALEVARVAALMRWIQSARNVRFLLRRSR